MIFNLIFANLENVFKTTNALNVKHLTLDWVLPQGANESNFGAEINNIRTSDMREFSESFIDSGAC